MNPCLRFAPMIGSRPRELSPEDRHALDGHLAVCAACRGRLADHEAVAGWLGMALMEEANRRDFAEFADEVLARTVRRRRRRRAFFAALLAPAAAAAALVLYFAVGSSDRHGPLIEVSAEGRGAIVLQTREGPVVLIGNGDPEGT